VTPKGLETAVNWLREGSLLGMNVTKPHKRAIAPLLDELRGDATLSGAVNTVKKENGRLIGYNTDMEGLAAALASRGRSYRDSIVTIFGAGGAAAGIAAKAAADGASSVNVVCRRPAAEVSSLFPDGVAIIAHDISSGAESAEAANAIESADILINATPLGMSGMTEDFTGFGFLDRLRQGVLVCDLIYEPAETGFLREARKRGHETMNGLPMLIYQGILTDEIVLDLRPDREYLYAEIMSEYSRRQERKRKAT
jgi:shikimate dehydrogenase